MISRLMPQTCTMRAEKLLLAIIMRFPHSAQVGVRRRGEKLPSPADLIDTVRDVVADLGLTIVIEPVRRSRLSTRSFMSCFGWPANVISRLFNPNDSSPETAPHPDVPGRDALWWPTRRRW